MTNELRNDAEALYQWLGDYGGGSQAQVSTVRQLMNAALGACGNCKYADVENSPVDYVYCTLRTCFYNGKTMQTTARCERWEAR